MNDMMDTSYFAGSRR